MSEMIERVARAICSERCFNAEVLGTSCLDEAGRNGTCRATINKLVLSGRWTMARAVISAMREPTEIMFMVGGNAEPYNRTQTGRMHWRRIGDLPARDCWQLMIDAALKETK